MSWEHLPTRILPEAVVLWRFGIAFWVF